MLDRVDLSLEAVLEVLEVLEVPEVHCHWGYYIDLESR